MLTTRTWITGLAASAWSEAVKISDTEGWTASTDDDYKVAVIDIYLLAWNEMYQYP